MVPVRPYRPAAHENEKAAAEAKPRRLVCGGQLHKQSAGISDGRIETAAISGGRVRIAIIVKEEKRPWQAWQRPTLPSLET